MSILIKQTVIHSTASYFLDVLNQQHFFIFIRKTIARQKHFEIFLQLVFNLKEIGRSPDAEFLQFCIQIYQR